MQELELNLIVNSVKPLLRYKGWFKSSSLLKGCARAFNTDMTLVMK